MDENNLTIAEIFKQMQFEKKNLQYKVNYLESRLSSIEENHELVLSTLTESQNSIKSLENKLNLVRQDLKEKENIIDMSEFYKEKILETTQNLSAELKTLKKILNQQNYNEEVELLKNKLSDLEKTFSQQAKEKSKLEFELTNMSEELMFHISNEGNLAKQIKKLEIEKLELKADNKTLLYGNLDDKTKSIDIYERFLTTTPDWDFSTPDVNLFEKDFKTYNEVLSLTTFNKEHKNINLWKEILEVEKKEDMQEKNEDKSALKKYCRTINEFKNCGCNYQDFQLRTFYFPDISNPSQESHISPESNSKQCDSATGGEYTNVICKNVIQLNQPETYSTVKTVSTASQTEFYENVSPVKLSRLDQKNQLKEDVFDKEVQYFSKKEEEIKIKTNCQTFLNYKNCDLDMDIYRMCEPCEKLMSNHDVLVENCKKNYSSNFNSLQQKFKFLTKFEDCLCHFSHFSKNRLALKAQENESLNIETDQEVKHDKFEDCLEFIRTLNVKSCNSDNEETDHSGFFLSAKDFSTEEINKIFEELNFAFKMDFSTIDTRLCFLCRVKNQAEINLEKEFQSFKLRLQNFQFLFESVNLCSKDRLSLISDLSRGINFLENAVTHLIEIAVAYGYTHHEAEFLKFIFIMVENVKNIEKIKNEALKIAERFKAATESAISFSNKDLDVYPLKRRSFSVSNLKSYFKRTEFADTLSWEILSYCKENLSSTKMDKNFIKAEDLTTDTVKLCKYEFGSSKSVSKKANFQNQSSNEISEPLFFHKNHNRDISESISSNQSKDPLKNFAQSLTEEESVNFFFLFKKNIQVEYDTFKCYSVPLAGKPSSVCIVLCYLVLRICIALVFYWRIFYWI